MDSNSNSGQKGKHDCCRRLVDDFDHNVIIIEEKTRKVLLLNKVAAKRIRLGKNDSLNLDFTRKMSKSLDIEAKVFASLSKEIIKSREIEHCELQEHIRESECNLSLKDIIK